METVALTKGASSKIKVLYFFNSHMTSTNQSRFLEEMSCYLY